ncbi:type IV pilin protein [Candidatus Pelagibacter bacterium nBUS_36]|uniref:type IV pilin protein n=1 Tax=Candidatus Pelagibacter bacterium nBUS_36 TaxID=3374194 RepID=UPI003EBD8F7F
MNQKAFTLIELLVVVAIIGILATVGVVAYNKFTLAAKKSVTKQQYKLFVNLMESQLAFCYLGDSNMKLMYKQEDPTYYDYSCKVESHMRNGRTAQLINFMINHAKNLGGGSKGGKTEGGQWLNPYSEGGINAKTGKRYKASWDPGNAFDDGPKGMIQVELKYPCDPYCKIVISTQYDDSHEPRVCNKNCKKLSKEIIDKRKSK